MMDIAKVRPLGRAPIAAARFGLSLVAVAAGCSSGGGSPPPSSTSPAPAQASATAAATTGATTGAQAPQPIAGDVERTTFSAELGVDLSKMSRRTSGLYVQDMATGSGAVAARTRTAVVRYVGYLANGKQFDAGEITITMGSNKVIRAWEDGVLGMRVGGKRRLVSPPHLAYGARGAPPAIPSNAVLVFDMELMSVY